MANVGNVQTAAEQQQLAVQSQQLGPFQYFGELAFDGSPAAQEIFLGGIKDARFNIPDDSYVFGYVVCSAWNKTDGDNPAGAIIYFGVENDGGTMASFPTNLRATDGNPIVEFSAGIGTWAVSTNGSEKAIAITFTGTANKTYDVQATMHYAISGANFRRPNAYGTTT